MLYIAIVDMHMTEVQFWSMATGLWLDLLACHRQRLNRGRPERDDTEELDGMFPDDE